MNKKILVIFLLLLTVLFTFSFEHNLGFSFQGHYAAIANFNISTGIDYEIYLTKYFSLENILLLGYTFDRTYVRPGILPNYDGGAITYYFYPNFRYGNNRVKFFFSPLGFKFYITVGRTETLYRVNYDNKDYSVTEFDYSISPGISFLKVGLNIYLGKNYNIILTPIYLYADYFLISMVPNSLYFGVFYSYAFQFGAGISLKFKLGKEK